MVEVDGSATVLVRRRKTDPEGRGASVYVAADTVAPVREWLERGGIARGRVFRSLCRGVLGAALDPSQIPRIYKGMARQAGLPPGWWTACPSTAPGSAPPNGPSKGPRETRGGARGIKQCRGAKLLNFVVRIVV